MGQASNDLDPLKGPSGIMLCRSIPAKPADSAAFMFEFVDGVDSTDRRTSLIAFDSAGGPLFMMVDQPWQNAKGHHGQLMIAARFAPVPSGGRLFIAPRMMATPDGTDSVQIPKGVEEEMSVAEVRQAETLARLLWNRRCKELPAPPQQIPCGLKTASLPTQSKLPGRYLRTS